MKKILLSLLLAAFLLLPKLSFAQSCPQDHENYSNQYMLDNCSIAEIANLPETRIMTFSSEIITQISSNRLQQFTNDDLIKVGQATGNLIGFLNRFSNNRLLNPSFSYDILKQLPQERIKTFSCEIQQQLGYACPSTMPSPTRRPTPSPSTPPSPKPSVSPSTQPTVTPSAAPVTVTKITIDDKEIGVPQAGSQLNLHLSISDLTNETDVPIRILVTYSDNTTKPFIINFHYKPKQEAIPVSDQTQEVKVLVLKYFPLDSTGSQLNENITGMNTNLAKIRQYVDNLTRQGLQKLTEGSKFHGYKTNSPPALNYTLTDTKEFLIPMPLSTNKIPWNNAFRPDYNKMLNDISICDYVDTKGVSQVWVWGYHTDTIEPAESNMSMGTNSKNFWPQGTYGDISNSEQIDDMPICQKTYTLYNYSYQRGLGELLEDHGHHIEAVLRFVDYDLFWNKFVAPHGETGGVNNCGWMHAPPNVSDNNQYDWTNKTKVSSACKDWKPLGDGTAVESIDCSEWGCANDTGASYKVWWMQNLPGINNDLTYQGNTLRNWWVFIGDFDSAIASGKSLTAVSHKFSVQSAKTSKTPQSDNNYVPPASLPHPSYPPDISIPSPLPTSQPTPTSTPEPLKLIDFNNDGQINVFDYIIFARKKLGR